MSAGMGSFGMSAEAANVGNVFTRYREELEWLAHFLTCDRNVAAACVVDACALAESENPDLREWLLQWARVATIRSAVQIQQRRIAQLSSVYTKRPCMHGGHLALSTESVEIMVEESMVLTRTLDVLCRCVLVICGLEKRSTQEAAVMLGVDSSVAEAAYCAAVSFLEVFSDEQFQVRNDFASSCN